MLIWTRFVNYIRFVNYMLIISVSIKGCFYSSLFSIAPYAFIKHFLSEDAQVDGERFPHWREFPISVVQNGTLVVTSNCEYCFHNL